MNESTNAGSGERITVAKVGGSLLELPDLAGRLRCVLSQRPGSRPLLLVGGGAAADLVRRWDAVHGLDHETSHWLAIRAMAVNERLVESLLDDSIVVSSRAEAEVAWRGGRVPILCCFEFLRTEESAIPHDSKLPHSWDATSDSIAACVAQRWTAHELVLLKSCDPPVESAGDAVDRLFATIAAGLPRIGWVNLRDDVQMIRSLDMFRRDSEALRRGACGADTEPAPRSSPKTPSRG
jgi:aspartokinase-like uncharacterized kinase